MQDFLDSFIKVEAGNFVMGSEHPEYPDEASHNVSVATFCIQESPVTQKLWEAVMDNNPSFFKTSKNSPVSNLSCLECRRFIHKINKKMERKFRLPTEIEWEYAARGGAKRSGFKYSGSNDLSTVAWYASNSNNETHDVKQKNPNELSLYDMNGNVWEWCSSSFGSLGIYRIFCGGSYASEEYGCKLENRSYDLIYRNSIAYGLRLVLEK